MFPLGFFFDRCINLLIPWNCKKCCHFFWHCWNWFFSKTANCFSDRKVFISVFTFLEIAPNKKLLLASTWWCSNVFESCLQYWPVSIIEPNILRICSFYNFYGSPNQTPHTCEMGAEKKMYSFSVLHQSPDDLKIPNIALYVVLSRYSKTQPQVFQIQWRKLFKKPNLILARTYRWSEQYEKCVKNVLSSYSKSHYSTTSVLALKVSLETFSIVSESSIETSISLNVAWNHKK